MQERTARGTVLVILNPIKLFILTTSIIPLTDKKTTNELKIKFKKVLYKNKKELYNDSIVTRYERKKWKSFLHRC